LRHARELGDNRLLADVLRRCAVSFSEEGVEVVRAMYEESVVLFRGLGHDDDTARALSWWGQFETEVGNYDGAVKRLIDARPLAGEELAVSIGGDIAGCYFLMGDRANAELSVREALALAAKFRDSIQIAFAISYIAALSVECKPNEAAQLIGYAEELLRTAGWERPGYERAMIDRLRDALTQRLTDADLSRLLAKGAAMREEEAIACATAVASSFNEDEELTAT